MAQKSRLLGRDVQVRIAKGGVPQTTITAIKSMTFEVVVRSLEEGYLGETGVRLDDIYDRVGGTLVVHPEHPEVLQLQKAIADRAIARKAGEDQISITFRCTWPGGQVAKVIIPEVVFDTIPFAVGARDSYVEATLTFKAEKYSLQV